MGTVFWACCLFLLLPIVESRALRSSQEILKAADSVSGERPKNARSNRKRPPASLAKKCPTEKFISNGCPVVREDCLLCSHCKWDIDNGHCVFVKKKKKQKNKKPKQSAKPPAKPPAKPKAADSVTGESRCKNKKICDVCHESSSKECSSKLKGAGKACFHHALMSIDKSAASCKTYLQQCKPKQCVESSRPGGLACKTPSKTKYNGRYNAATCKKVDPKNKNDDDDDSDDEDVDKPQGNPALAKQNTAIDKVSPGIKSVGQEFCIQGSLGPMEVLGVKIGLEVALAGSFIVEKTAGQPTTLEAKFSGSIGVQVGFVVVQAALYYTGTTSFTGVLPASITDPMAGLAFLIGRFAEENAPDTSMGNFLKRNIGREKNLAAAAKAAREGIDWALAYGDSDKGLAFMGPTEARQEHVMMEESRDLFQHFIKEIREQAPTIQNHVSREKKADKKEKVYRDHIQRIFRKIYLNSDATVNPTMLTSSPKCTKMAGLSPMQKITCQFFATGGLLFGKSASRSHKNINEMIPHAFPELFPTKNADDTTGDFDINKAVARLKDIIEQAKTYEAYLKQPANLKAYQQLAELEKQFSDNKGQMKVSGSSSQAAKQNAFAKGSKNHKLAVGPLFRARQKVKAIKEARWLGHVRVGGMYYQSIHFVLSSDPDKLQKNLQALRAAKYAKETGVEGFKGAGLTEMGFEGTWGVTVGKDGVGFCTPDGNPLQITYVSKKTWKKITCPPEKKYRPACFSSVGESEMPVKTLTFAAGTWVQVHFSRQQDTMNIGKKWLPWSRAEDPNAPYIYKVLVQLRVNSDEGNPAAPPPDPPSTALEHLNDAIDGFFTNELKLGAPAAFLTKFAGFMSEYRGTGTERGVLDTFVKSLIPGKGMLSTLMTGIFTAHGGPLKLVTDKNLAGFDIEYDRTNKEFSVSISSNQYKGFKTPKIPIPAIGMQLVVQGYYSHMVEFTVKRWKHR